MPSFWISKTEVTSYDYSLCVNDGACTAPTTRYSGCTYGDEDKLDHPVNCIEWNQAVQFTEWCDGGDTGGISISLPTEAQWEYAARSQGQSRRYQQRVSSKL